MKLSLLYYATGNSEKFANAKCFFEKHNIVIKQLNVEVDEIQNDNLKKIALNKASAVYEQVKKPLFVNDAGWLIPALNGFPGPYMKDINQWFRPQDFLLLLSDKKDRKVILRDTIVYIDEFGSQVFTNDCPGSILLEAYGTEGRPSDNVISLTKSKKSIAEEVKNSNFLLDDEEGAWLDFVKWLKLNK